jgi:hypothetical protein
VTPPCFIARNNFIFRGLLRSAYEDVGDLYFTGHPDPILDSSISNFHSLLSAAKLGKRGHGLCRWTYEHNCLAIGVRRADEEEPDEPEGEDGEEGEEPKDSDLEIWGKKLEAIADMN